MNMYLAGVIISIIVYIIIGNYAGKKVKDVDDYYVSGRNAPTLLIAGTLFASMMSTNGFLGDTAWVYSGNFSLIMIMNIFTSAGYVIGPIFFGRYIRRAEALTMPAYFGERFNSRKIQSFAGFTTVIALTVYLVAVTKGTAYIMEELTGFSTVTCLLIASVCFTSFTFYSGSKGVVITDTIMFMLFISATIVAAPFIIGQAGGLSDLTVNILSSSEAPTDILSYHSSLGGGSIMDNMSYAIALGLVWMVAVAVSPWQASRGLMAKNEHVTIRSGSVAALCTVFFMGLTYLIALAMVVIEPGIEPVEKMMIHAAMDVMPKVVGVIVLTGIMAAGLSSASTFLSVSGFSAVNDVVDIKFKDESKKLWATRWVMLVVAVIALVFAYLDPAAIRIISWFATMVIAASWGVVAFMSVWSKKITANGAFWSMAVAFVAFIVTTTLKKLGMISLPGYLHPFYFGIAGGFIGAYLGSKNSKITDEEKAFFKKMHTVPESETDPEMYRMDRVFGKILISGGVLITAILLVFWAIPYNNFVG